MRIHIRSILACLVVAACFSAVSGIAGEILVKSGESIAFLGDSITAQGADKPLGYVRLVVAGLETNGVHVKSVPAGISGHKSNDMLARLQRDVIDKKPTWMTLSCGVNDVWHGAAGVPLESYKTNITAIVEKALAADIRVMILTATLIGEDVTNRNNQIAIPYNDFLRKLAKEKNLPIADLNAQERAALAAIDESARKRGNQLTGDGVHMNINGDQMMATGILRAFGLDDGQIARAREFWLNIPGGVIVGVQPRISLKEYQLLETVADKQKRNVDAMVNEAVAVAVSNLVQSAK